MTHRGPFQPLPFCDSVIRASPRLAGVVLLKAAIPPCERGPKRVRTTRSRHLTAPLQAYNLDSV